VKVEEKTWDEYWAHYLRIEDRHIHEPDEELVDRVVGACEHPNGGSILDLACGTGEHARMFDGKGFLVSAWDKSRTLIEYARKHNYGPNYCIGNYEDIEYNSAFDLVTILGKAFGYLDEVGNVELLRKIRQALKPDGRAFIQYTTIEEVAGLDKQVWEEIEGGYSLERHRYGSETSTYYSRYWHIMLDGRIIEPAREAGYTANQVVRCYGVSEIENICENVGFMVMDAKPGDLHLCV